MLSLHEPQDLFRVPELDPFEGQYATASGIERISRKLAAMPLKQGAPALRILLPPEAITPGLAADTRRALMAFAEAELEQLAERRAALVRERRRALVVGLGFLALCLALSTLIDRLQIGPPWLARLGVEGLVIAGWVALWHPLELTLYAGWPLRHDRRVLLALKRAQVTVEPE